MRNRSRILLLISVLLILFQLKGYYKRSIEINDEFLSTICETIIILEEKKDNNLLHSKDDDEEIYFLLNRGDMAKNSRRELDIKSRVGGMSYRLYLFNNENSSGNQLEANEALGLYNTYLEELKNILTDYRSKSESVERLWEIGIFK